VRQVGHLPEVNHLPGKVKFLREVSIAMSTRYTEWCKNHLTLVISEQKGRTRDNSFFSSSIVTANKDSGSVSL
jgi:hypothetical protein